MSAGASSGGGQDFDLNLAPIIDCFTVLITFLLVSASFLSVGLLDAGVAAAGAQQASNATPPPVNIAIELKAGGSLVIEVTGKASHKTTVKELGALSKELAALKAKWPAVTAATISADNAVEYKEVVKTMETTRKHLPAVMLGGF